MGVEVKGAGDGVVIADRGCNDGSASSRTLLKTPRLLASIE